MYIAKLDTEICPKGKKIGPVFQCIAIVVQSSEWKHPALL